MLKRFAVLLLAGGAMYAHAAMMFGIPDCGSWVMGDRPYNQRWLTGYISGLNSALSRSDLNDPLLKVTATQMILWMDNYCKANPLKTVNDGAIDLYAELLSQLAKKRP